jgi:hypothetical protein
MNNIVWGISWAESALQKGVFLNEDRQRYYWLRVGDIVGCQAYHVDEGEVVELGGPDNNRVFVKTGVGEVISCVAEWCEIIIKVEEKNKI